MSDTLEVFGREWTNVAGFKATDDNDTIKTFIRPQGTINISQNGQGIDVSQYASADVAVPSVETNFIVTVSWNSTTQMWEPDCTFAEYQTAYNAGKTITVQTDDPENASADGIFFGSTTTSYIVRQLMFRESYHGQNREVTHEYWYDFTATGVGLVDDYSYVNPSGTLSINQNGTGIDVAAYARVNVAVPSSSPTIESLTVTPSTSQQVFNASGVDGYKPVTVDAMPTMTLPTSAVPTTQASGQRIGTIFPQSVGDRAINIPVGYNDTAKYYNIIPADLMALTITENGVYDPADPYDVYGFGTITVNVSGGSSKNIQVNSGSNSVRTNGYTSTGHSLTVAKTGTYKVSWTAWRSSSQGTMGTNLHRNDTAGTNQQTWTNTYGQHIVLENQSYTAGDVLTLYATAGSTSRYCWVAGLTIEEQ